MPRTIAIYLVALSIVFVGCVNFRQAAQQAIVHTHSVNKGLFQESAQYLGGKIRSAAMACHSAGDTKCQKARDLIKIFRKVAKLSSWIDMALIVAQKAVIDSDVSGYNKIMGEIVQNLGLIRELLERV